MTLEFYGYDKDTEILTEKGFKKFSEFKGTDHIATLNPNTLNIEYLKPAHWYYYHFKGKLLDFRNRWSRISVTPNHHMVTNGQHDFYSWFVVN